jgi:hypothetical protein
LAWRLQALAEGDLSERTRRRAAELAQDADLRLTPPRPGTAAVLFAREFCTFLRGSSPHAGRNGNWLPSYARVVNLKLSRRLTLPQNSACESLAKLLSAD